ncbi:SRPBCC family protein [Amycolatopsis cihanbeyliensis]|uniref:Polyketide cyclase/dehydrase/lipid transport protein n=1 Tax=Amycolatopsis cihanbeyliensis TaxID=1128664 RepID=A0A542DEM1_AMYCI|nr:SRPBCC family protein [Amycolatopsis cihanbeyliensis]TQJ01504.1 polyketide cyclase/dehydrase/lipid transport protein [Amycolatopsis cihanbeyliensis]
MSLVRYRFRTTWTIGAPPPIVFATLVDLGGYPSWWPNVRSVSRIDDETAELVCRSVLPFALTVHLTRVEENPGAGRLEVALAGDLEGMLSGLVHPHGAGTRLEIAQHVVARKRLLRWLSPLAHPVFRANHALMMRRGRHGLCTRLAGPGGDPARG